MVLQKSPEVLRTAGLSGRKVEYVLDLSARFVDGRLKAEDMVHDSDEEIVRKLVEVRGIGQWSKTPLSAASPVFKSSSPVIIESYLSRNLRNSLFLVIFEC
jgi:hypothetical protein